jgi:MFS family permease
MLTLNSSLNSQYIFLATFICKSKHFISIFFEYSIFFIDVFAPKSVATVWMSLLQGSVAAGIVLGYLLGGMLTNYGGDAFWRMAYCIQSIIIFLILLFFVFCKDKYLNTDAEENTDAATVIESGTSESTSESNKKGTSNPSSGSSSPRRRNKLSFSEQIKILSRCRVWMCVTVALAALFFVVTGIQYWITDYMVKVLNCDPHFVIIGFAITSLTGPVLGVFFGGWVIDKTGGYKDSSGKSIVNALKICSIFGGLALVFSFPAAFATDGWTVFITGWFVLFWGGCIVPPAMGITVSTVPPEMRPTAGAMSFFFYNVFGYAAAPYICGYIAHLASLTWGYRSVFAVSTVSLCTYK